MKGSPSTPVHRIQLGLIPLVSAGSKWPCRLRRSRGGALAWVGFQDEEG